MAKVEIRTKTLEQNMGAVMRILATCPIEERRQIVAALVGLYAPKAEA